MYIPNAFKIEDPDLIREIARANAFATMIATIEGEPFATHLPFLLGEENGQDILYGHVAKANPHARHLETKTLVIFAGPHGYVSPSWYETRPNVPTWNYVSVHAYGTPQIIEDQTAGGDHLREMVQKFDPNLNETHPEATSEETVQRLLPGVIVFRMPVDRWEAKAKLNQNRKEEDRQAVIARYERSDLPDEKQMAILMRQRQR